MLTKSPGQQTVDNFFPRKDEPNQIAKIENKSTKGRIPLFITVRWLYFKCI